MPRNDYSAETEARPVFEVRQPLPERKRGPDGEYLPDPPIDLGPDYSMMAMLRREHEHFMGKATQFREPNPPAVRPVRPMTDSQGQPYPPQAPVSTRIRKKTRRGKHSS